MQTIGDRIRMRRKELQITQAELSKRVGISAPAISQLEKGESKAPSSTNLLALAQALTCTPDWLQKGIDKEVAISSDFINIPILDVELAAGAGTHIDAEQVTDWAPVSKDWLYDNNLNSNFLVIVRVSGDSMSPRLQDEDMLLVDTADTRPATGNVYAIAVDNELRVKRLIKRIDGCWAISSDNKSNPAYQDEIVSHHNFEQLRIIGKVIRVLMGKV